MQGMYIIFCNNIAESEKNIPFGLPNIATKDDIVYPKQNPLKAIIPYSIGTPITVHPTNQIKTDKSVFSIIEFFKSSNLLISLFSFKEVIKLFM